jgi:TRAP-type mannitol/chloroaromatic compound transport system permease large subunit
MKGVAPPEIAMSDVIRAALPYLFMGALLLVLIFFVPPIATWLPSRV